MKKLLFTINVCALMLLFADCSGKSANKNVNNDADVAIEIPDTIFKSYLVENFDKNKDGNITVEEAKEIKDLNIAGMGIEKLDGIEQFANLASLDCSNNQLDELELRYNKNLNKLVCTGNKAPLTIYIGMTSPLRKNNVKRPASGTTPQVENMQNPLDETKATFDEGKTNVMLYYDE
jgi:Leucine-rich repeat (LRR) protein